MINKKGNDAAIEIVCNGFMLSTDNSTNANSASIIAQIIFLKIGGLGFPS